MFICAKGLLRMTTVRAPKNYNGCMCRGEVRKRARMQGMELQSGVAPNAMSIARLQPWPNRGPGRLGIGDDSFFNSRSERFNSRSERLAVFSATKRIYLLTTKRS